MKFYADLNTKCIFTLFDVCLLILIKIAANEVAIA